MKAIVKETNEEVEVRLLRPVIYSRLDCNGKVIEEYNEDELLIDPKETSVCDDLETEIEWFAKTNESNDYVKIARHFAEWGKINKNSVDEDIEKECERLFGDCRVRKGAFKLGADYQSDKDKKAFELLKEWFEDIAEKCEHLTSGNVSHNGKMIRGFARNCAEYIKIDLL